METDGGGNVAEPVRTGALLDLAQAAGVDRRDAELLLAALMRVPRARLRAFEESEVDAFTRAMFGVGLQRLADGEPLAYITGVREFWSLPLTVSAAVLVPRPETELLVERCLAVLDAAPRTVADLGTGSGAIALALASRRPDAVVEAVDASAGALEVAAANARALGLAVAFRQGDWLNGVGETYDLIVSNPPYVAAADPHLAALTHEPLSALAAGPDGLDDLRVIAAAAPARLRPSGWLLLEHGHDQAGAVRTLLTTAGLAQAQSRHDLAGLDRCTAAQKLELA